MTTFRAAVQSKLDIATWSQDLKRMVSTMIDIEICVARGEWKWSEVVWDDIGETDQWWFTPRDRELDALAIDIDEAITNGEWTC